MPTAEIHVEADGTRLAQVLQNLLVNAAKYTPEGGRIEVSVNLDGSRLITTVRDNGLGLTPEAIEQIFELFSQGDSQSAAKESGLGIGLTLARSLVEMHGGVLTAASAGPGTGSSFSFFIPNAWSDAVPQDGRADDGKPRCLIVDDNRDSADSMAQIVRLMGCSVRIAYDGESALQQVPQFQPHLALLDLGMPGMNGYQLLKALRAQPGGDTLMAAAVTGYGNEEDRQRTKAAGFDAHLVKPVDFSLLQAFLARATAQAAVTSP
jgi:CheY-like chemotaxis protein